MNYKIYQITNYNDCDYKFDGWNYAKDKFNFKRDYTLIYEGKVEPNENSNIDILEDLFYIFNMKHPSDFKGHSLSVSDIVELDGVCYYCDSTGWKKL